MTAETASVPPSTTGDPGDPGEPAEPTDGDLPEVDEHPPRSWLVRAVVVVLACAFLAGAIGYAIGVRQEQTPSNAVDVGFLTDMSDHHDQAVTMALTALDRSTDPTIRSFARDILIFQRSELGQMAAYLDAHDAVRPDYDPDRPAMGWMDMAMPVSRMTGMASEDQLAELADASGRDFDLLFLDLLTIHHRGAVEMAEYAAANAADPNVRTLAARMASQQATEIEEYAQHRARIAP